MTNHMKIPWTFVENNLENMIILDQHFTNNLKRKSMNLKKTFWAFLDLYPITPATFSFYFSCGLVVLWIVSGPIFDYSDAGW